MYTQIGRTAAKACGSIGLACVLVCSQIVFAAPLPETNKPLVIAQQPVSLQQAVSKVQAQYGGRVLKAEPANAKGRAGYRIRLMSDGRVREFMVDANSGEVITP